MGRGVRLLLVDTDERQRTRTRTALEETDLVASVAVAATPDAAMESVNENGIDGVVSAFDFDDEDPLSFFERVREYDDSLPFVLFSENGSSEIASEVYADDRADYVLDAPGAEMVLGDRIDALLDADDGQSATTEESPTQSQELARERERLSDLFSNFPEPTVAYELDEKSAVFKAVNDAFEDVFGLSEEEIHDESVNELIVPDEIQVESEEIDDQVDSGDMVDRVVERLAADGRRIFNLRSIPVSASGEIDGFAVYSDITERKRRERELERYETIVQTIPMGVMTVNDDWKIDNINQPGAEILGYDIEGLLGAPFAKLYRDGVITGDAIALAEEIVEELRTGKIQGKKVVEVAIAPAPDVTRELEVHTSLLPTEDGFTGVVLVFHDITDRKENERELRRQNERLEEFASIVSHDLRNPLNVAMGHLEIVQDQHESSSLDHVADALDRMETLIRETLQLAKQGEMVTETTSIQLSDIVDDCWEMIAQDEATLERTGDIRFEADPSRARQLFENLFRNAVEHGGAEVTIHVGVDDDVIFVADDGPGIPPEERDTVFETGHTTSKDGTGFGLAIVEEIVDAHDWEITVEESWAGGARFEISGFERGSSA